MTDRPFFELLLCALQCG